MSRYTGTYSTLAVKVETLADIWLKLKDIGDRRYMEDHRESSEPEWSVRIGDVCLVPDRPLTPGEKLLFESL